MNLFQQSLLPYLVVLIGEPDGIRTHDLLIKSPCKDIFCHKAMLKRDRLFRYLRKLPLFSYHLVMSLDFLVFCYQIATSFDSGQDD